MDNHERLVEYHTLLCKALNENGIKWKCNDKELNWPVDEYDPFTTFLGGIYSDGRAFKYLKDNGYMDKGICISCGNSPIDKKYTFRSGLSPDRELYVCRSCSSEGKKSSVYYDNNSNKGACYIATACYGDYNANEVLILRKYRDDVLSQKILGRIFIQTYYFFSPRLANWLGRKRKLNSFVRKYILNKIVDILRKK